MSLAELPPRFGTERARNTLKVATLTKCSGAQEGGRLGVAPRRRVTSLPVTSLPLSHFPHAVITMCPLVPISVITMGGVDDKGGKQTPEPKSCPPCAG